MKAGSLRIWLTFQRREETQDEIGQPVAAWVDAFEVGSKMPCRVAALSGRELIAAQSVRSEVTTRIMTRYREGLSASMRAVSPKGTIYNVLSVIPDPVSTVREVTLLCSSGLNEG